MKRIINILSKSKIICKLSEKIILRNNNDMNADIGKNGEKHFIEYLSKILPKDAVLFDIGANKGEYSKLLQLNIENSDIYAFDPVKENIDRAKRITENKINYITSAVSDFDGKVNFFIDTKVENSGHSSMFDMNKIGYETRSEKREVDVIKLDSFAKNNGINKVDFMKIDIEGNELNALRGAEAMFLNKQVGIIQFEFGHASRASRTLLLDFVYFFKKYNYELFSVMPNFIQKIDYTPFEENRWHIINIVAIRGDLTHQFEEIIKKKVK